MILHRLKEYIDIKGITVSAFEKSIGMSNASFGRSLKNNGGIGTDKLENILNVYEDINPDWLLTGQGNMVRKNGETAKVSSWVEGGIPLVSYSDVSGFFVERKKKSCLGVECYYIPLFKEADFLLAVRDHTMTPHYMNGDIVACKCLPTKGLFFQWNKIYLLQTSQGVLIKRVHPGKDDEHLLLVSENPEYVPFELQRSQIMNVALVQGRITVE